MSPPASAPTTCLSSSRALLPGSPSSPRLSRALLMALVLGLAAGFGIAYVLERLDDKIRSVEQLELISSLSTLGVIPNVSDVDRGTRRSSIRFVRSLPFALHRAAVRDGERFAENTNDYKFRTIGRKVAHVSGDREALRHVGAQGAAG